MVGGLSMSRVFRVAGQKPLWSLMLASESTGEMVLV